MPVNHCPALQTKNYRLQPLARQHAVDIFELRSSPEVSRYLDRPLMKRPEEATEFVAYIEEGTPQGDYLYWVIERKEDKQVAGTICLWRFDQQRSRADLGYELKPAFQGQGIMGEALQRVVRYARDTLSLYRLYACTNEANEASLRLLKRANFTFERKLFEDPNMQVFVLHFQGLPAYLQRIGLEPFSKPGLVELHRAHLFSIPFENLDIHLGRAVSIQQEDIFRKLVQQRRGGFCYEHNGLFRWALQQLGYTAHLVQGQVYSTERKEYGPPFDHVAVWVETPDGPFLADVGFGNAPLVPMPVRDGAEEEGTSGRYRLEFLPKGQYRISHREGREWVPDYIFDGQPRRVEECEPMALYHQTSQESPFTQKRLISLPKPEGGRVTISGNELIIKGDNGPSKVELEGEDSFREALSAHFGVVLE